MEKSTASYAITIIIGIVFGLIGFGLGEIKGSYFSRSIVYEIPMAKGQLWRVTSFQGKVYVLIEAPSMPEEIRKVMP